MFAASLLIIFIYILDNNIRERQSLFNPDTIAVISANVFIGCVVVLFFCGLIVPWVR